MRKEYTDFTEFDFLEDSDFLKWMNSNDPELDKFWNDWMSSKPKNLRELEKARRRFKILTNFEKITPNTTSKKRVWGELQPLLWEREYPSLWRKSKIWLAAVSACLLLVVGSYFFFQNPVEEEQWISILAEDGIKEVRLPDSTFLSLNKNASLKYRSENPREVWLEGEAIFRVNTERDENGNKKDFVVHSKDLSIKVLGTVFLMKEVERSTLAVLMEGEIRALAKGDSLNVTPGEKIEWNGENFHVESVIPDLYMAWEDGYFHFKRTSVDDLAALIKDFYGYNFTVKNKELLKTQFISGTIATDNIPLFWKTLETVFHSKIEVDGKDVVMTAFKN